MLYEGKDQYQSDLGATNCSMLSSLATTTISRSCFHFVLTDHKRPGNAAWPTCMPTGLDLAATAELHHDGDCRNQERFVSILLYGAC